jgi:hypothetical protein
MVLDSRQQQMSSLASYNLDKFSRFVLSGRFVQIFDADDDELAVVRCDDDSPISWRAAG